jgi:hypothetical protein
MRGRGKEREIGSVRENGKFHQLFQVLVFILLQALSGNKIRNTHLVLTSVGFSTRPVKGGRFFLFLNSVWSTL